MGSKKKRRTQRSREEWWRKGNGEKLAKIRTTQDEWSRQPTHRILTTLSSTALHTGNLLARHLRCPHHTQKGTELYENTGMLISLISNRFTMYIKTSCGTP